MYTRKIAIFAPTTGRLKTPITALYCISGEKLLKYYINMVLYSYSSKSASFRHRTFGKPLPKARVQIAAATLSGNNLRQTAHTHCTSVHQTAKLVAALLRVAGVTAGLGKVMAAYRRVYGSRHLQADCQEPRSAPELYAR